MTSATIPAMEWAHVRLAELVDSTDREYARGAGEICGVLADAFRCSDWDAMQAGVNALKDRPADYRAGAYAALDIFLDVIDALNAARVPA